MSSMSTFQGAQLTVYFDGACPICSGEMAYYRRQRGAKSCAWVDASSCADAEFGPDLPRDVALGRFHVRRADGQLIAGARGFAALWRVLPRTAWLGRLASFGPLSALLEIAYRGFLKLRRLWRPTPQTSNWPLAILADLRSDHAGEAGAVQIYRGILCVTRDADLRSFAEHHLATEQEHLALIGSHLSVAQHSVLLQAWCVAGWLTGALPALFGPRVVYATVAAVETFVDRHYAEQISRLDALPADRDRAALRADLERCRLDELHHRDEAIQAGAATGLAVRLWAGAAKHGSAAAVALARRL